MPQQPPPETEPSHEPPVLSLDERRRVLASVSNRAALAWLVLAAVLNLVWALTSDFQDYYWPAWPLLTALVPVVGLVAARLIRQRVTPR